MRETIMVTQIIFLVIGIGVGVLIGFLAFNKKKDESGQLVSDERVRAAESISDSLRRDIQSTKDEITQERGKSESLQIKLASLQTEKIGRAHV